MDLLAALPKTLPLIVPSTTIRETRHRSLPLYNRLQELVKDEDRIVWVWWNEERRETATVEEQGESINDRNDRGQSESPVRVVAADDIAIRNTLIFYAAHLTISASKPPQLIMLSDDKGNRALAEAEGLLAVSAREYVDGLVPTEREKLVDLVVGGVDALGDGERRGRRIYDEVS